MRKHWIQTTSDVSKGSSGSPVFNQKGEVIGIISKGDYDGNLNFAHNLVLDNLEYFIEKRCLKMIDF
ncbi:MAG: trypsin-like peptidase domain-containing protein [Saprospiraceae bacterium]|nr:trypsin-like peptidase domain-containing protein [Saprospiraceae bacterium]